MQSKDAPPPAVKGIGERKKRNSYRGKPGILLHDGCRRIRGYLLGCFSQGKEFHDWDKHRFHRCTQSLNPLTVRHIERIVGFYRKRCTEFIWQEIRVGRSTKLRVLQANPDAEAPSIPEVRRRLVGYIAATIRQNGVAHVDQEFLRHFHRATDLPPELIHLVWTKTRKMAGFRVRWRGVNHGQKMVVSRFHSPTHFSPGPYSTLCESEGIKPKTRGLTPPLGGSSAPLRAAPTNSPISQPDRPPPIFPKNAGRDEHPPDERRAVRASPDANYADRARASPGPPRPDVPPQPKTACRNWPPLAVAGRFVSGVKLARLAALLAVTRMRAPHDEFFRIKWLFVYPRNFAWRALREGFEVDEIVAAYASGVRRSHEDSLDRDRTSSASGEWIGEPSRVPSAAVAYAHAVLREDMRDREERWAAIFARGPRVAPPIDAAAAHARAPEPRREKEAPAAPAKKEKLSIADLRELLQRAPSQRTAVESDPEPIADSLTIRELLTWLREKKEMTPGQFAGLAFAWRQKLIAECREARRSQSKDL